jgi:hypothetical protein
MKQMKSDGNVRRSGQGLGQSNVYDGIPVECGIPNMLCFKRQSGNKTMFDFVEEIPKHGEPVVYTYCLETGNLTRGAGDRWARQEIKSASKAFHRERQDKMAIPNDFETAAKTVQDHYLAYKKRPTKAEILIRKSFET